MKHYIVTIYRAGTFERRTVWAFSPQAAERTALVYFGRHGSYSLTVEVA